MGIATDQAKRFSDAYLMSMEDIVSRLQADLQNGLDNEEVARRIQVYGLNSYTEQKQKNSILILLEQFRSPIILLLVFASGFSFFFQHWVEGFSIIGVILITVLIGFFMEMQARKSVKALKEMDVNISKVWRDTAQKEIPSEHLVPGDIVLLEAGDIVPADGRLIEVNQFEVDESTLTGESMQIEKRIEQIQKNADLGDQFNMVFKGTSVVKGNAIAIVTATGRYTELGKISSLVESADSVVTPLEKKLQGLTKKLMWITAGFALIFICTGLFHGKDGYSIVETAIALAVAAIPEGLPVVSTIALTYGMLRMAKQNVLIKRLASVETLGGVSVIFTDKTGTLTENKIKVNSLSFFFDEENRMKRSKMDIRSELKVNKIPFEKLLVISTLCNNAVVAGVSNHEHPIGDPIEVALLQWVASNQIDIDELNRDYPREAEQAFSSETKLMATLHKHGSAYFVAAKGALEELIQKCTSFYYGGEIVPLTKFEKDIFLKKADAIQSRGSRMLAFAFREDHTIATDHYLQDLTLVGLIGFLDPPRADVVSALQSCRNAGIKVIMITGDHPATALNIAQEIKLSDHDYTVIHGKDLNEQQTDEKLFAATIFARVSPKQKLEMVNHYQKRGDIVAMTGDGINDAPALKKADIGIAMGLRGTPVAKETAVMVLKDDSFASIVSAIEQGRIIFQNIKRFLVYLLSCNLSEILIVFFYGLLNFSYTILPLQILFLNLVTDIFPALALGVGKGNHLIMKGLPRNPQEQIILKKDWINVIVYALLLAAPIMSVTWYSNYYLRYSPEVCNNITFFSLAFSQLWHVFNLSSVKMSFFRNEITRNKVVWTALMLCITIILACYGIEPLKKTLGLQTLTPNAWLLIAVASFAPVVLIQTLKRLIKIVD